MGEEQSKPESEENTLGYHVTNVIPNSLAAQLQIEPYFDYLMGINSTRLDKNVNLQAVLDDVQTPFVFQIYNTRSNQVREVKIPSVPSEGIGMNIRFCDCDMGNKTVIHVTQVFPNSPAEKAGLTAESDYIIASPKKTFSKTDDFVNLIRDSKDQLVELIVYSTMQEKFRKVNVVPMSWSGNGLLGCDVGNGKMHRVPAKEILN